MMEALRQYSAPCANADRPTVRLVFLRLFRHPSYFLLHRWNWKSALLSCLIRGSIFFAVNSVSGFRAATYAMLLEISFLSVIAGFYGALLQAFRRARPEWAASLTLMVLLPAIHHSMEFLIHSFGGTKKLSASILASMSFSALSACFNLFTMRRGILIVGGHQQSLRQDLKQLPWVILEFLFFIAIASQRLMRNGVRHMRFSRSAQSPAIGQGELPKSGTRKGE